MGKIVGKALVAIFSCMALHIYADVTMRLTDMNGSEIEQAGVGQPFLLEVIITDGKSMQAPFITDADQFEMKRIGFHMSTVNGKSIVKYTYRMRKDEAGTYTIGPAIVQSTGFKFISKVITLIVGDESVVVKKSQKKKDDSYAFMRLSCDKKQVVVGEKIVCKLQFFYTDDSIRLKHCIEPEISGFSRKQTESPVTGNQEIDGKKYNYVEWRWSLYPSNSGRFVIPAYAADFEIYSKRNGQWGGLGRFLGLHIENKRVYSNGIKIEVVPLPPCDKKVNGVGIFKSINAFINPAVAKEGEGIVLAIELEGDGNFDEIDTPCLENISDAFKYYNSRQLVFSEENSIFLKKRFEYIVQGRKTGSWEIPKQTFTYFDVEKRIYKTLETNPLLITITPGIATAAELDITNKINNYVTKNKQNLTELAPLHNNGPSFPIPEKKPLPWWLFMLLCFAPIFPSIYRYLSLLFFGCYRRWFLNVESKHAFNNARSNLELAEKNGNITELYTIFVHLIANRCKLSKIITSGTLIQSILCDNGMHSNELAEWNNFYSILVEHVFGDTQIELRNKIALFNQARNWINRLEKIL